MLIRKMNGTLTHNGSADLRSPEKEVCFRSWDLANSQMCEVRVATSNICGCNPPNRCGERSGADFATTVKYKSSSGLKCTYFSENKMLNKCKNDSSSHPNRYCFYTLLYTVFILRMLQFLCPYYTRHQQF